LGNCHTVPRFSNLFNLQELNAMVNFLQKKIRKVTEIRIWKSFTIAKGPEPLYANIVSGFEKFHSKSKLNCDYGGYLPEFTVAYETWGNLNSDNSNVILLHTGLSASSHAKSHPKNKEPGWWEKFIGPGLAIDTNKYTTFKIPFLN
jgi:homoserine acetyltransferase